VGGQVVAEGEYLFALKPDPENQRVAVGVESQEA
jgi:hypothetical protein